MQLHLQPSLSWQQTNDWITNELGLDDKGPCVQVYQGVSHALVEACVGLSKLFPLKKKFYYFKSHSPYFDRALMPLAKEGLQIVALEDSVLDGPGEWVATLAREDLFVLYAVDDPFVGKKFDIEKLENSLADKPIARIRVSYADHFYNAREFLPTRNGVHIFSLSKDRSISIMGERCRVGSLAAQDLVWSESICVAAKDRLRESLLWFQNRESTASISIEKILNFEKAMPAGGKPLFQNGGDQSRLPDRAVLYWEDMEGSAYCERLIRALGLEGNTAYLASLSLIGTGDSLIAQYLQKTYGLSPEGVRGLITISHKLIENEKKLIETMVRVRADILKDQFGELPV